MKRCNGINSIIFAIFLSTAVIYPQQSWKEKAEGLMESGKKYSRAVFDAIRNNQRTTAAVIVGVTLVGGLYYWNQLRAKKQQKAALDKRLALKVAEEQEVSIETVEEEKLTEEKEKVDEDERAKNKILELINVYNSLTSGGRKWTEFTKKELDSFYFSRENLLEKYEELKKKIDPTKNEQISLDALERWYYNYLKSYTKPPPDKEEEFNQLKLKFEPNN
jgi:hypothetical protein